MTEPIPKEKVVVTYYDDYSKSYEDERRKGYYSLINDLEFEKVEPFARGKKTLEIGCGTGLILERVHEVAKEAVGVDISTGMLDVCRKKGLNVLEASATELPFEDNSFDMVYSFKVLAHVPEIEKAIKEIARVTKPKGRVVLEFYNPFSFKGINEKLRTMVRRGRPVYIRHDSLRGIRRLLPEEFRIVSTRGIRIFAPFAACYTMPVISFFFKYLDRHLCDSVLGRFGGYFVVEATK